MIKPESNRPRHEAEMPNYVRQQLQIITDNLLPLEELARLDLDVKPGKPVNHNQVVELLIKYKISEQWRNQFDNKEPLTLDIEDLRQKIEMKITSTPAV